MVGADRTFRLHDGERGRPPVVVTRGSLAAAVSDLRLPTGLSAGLHGGRVGAAVTYGARIGLTVDRDQGSLFGQA